MDEKRVVQHFGSQAFIKCDLIRRTIHSMRAHGLPKGDSVVQLEIAVKYLVGQDRLNVFDGEFILKDLSSRTALAVNRVSKTQRAEAWLL